MENNDKTERNEGTEEVIVREETGPEIHMPGGGRIKYKKERVTHKTETKISEEIKNPKENPGKEPAERVTPLLAGTRWFWISVVLFACLLLTLVILIPQTTKSKEVGLQTQLSEAKSDLKDTQNDLLGAERDLAIAQDSFLKAQKSLTETESALSKAQSDLAEVREDNSDLEDQATKLERTVERLEEDKEDLKDEVRYLEREIADLEDELDRRYPPRTTLPTKAVMEDFLTSIWYNGTSASFLKQRIMEVYPASNPRILFRPGNSSRYLVVTVRDSHYWERDYYFAPPDQLVPWIP